MTPSLLTFIAAGLLLNITPGPGMLYVTARTLGQGRAAGIVSALGIFAGCFVHILAAAAGFTALLAAVPWAFVAIRWVGAAYLVWMGVRIFLDRRTGPATGLPATGTLWHVFLQGAATNALNPKVALFFLALLPQFIGPADAHPAATFLTLGAIFNVNGLIVLMVIVALATRLRHLAGQGPWTRRLRQVMGATFIGLGVRLALVR